MKYLPFAAVFAALIPSFAHAQNPQFTNCHSLRAADNFVGSDEVLVNGQVCKMAKPKSNSAVSTPAPGKDTEKSMALLGIVEPETLRSKDKGEAHVATPARGATLAASEPAPQTPAVKSMALLGVVEPETLRAKQKAESDLAGKPQRPGMNGETQASDSTVSGMLQPPTFEMISGGSLGNIARAYRNEAGTRVTPKPEETTLQQKKLSTEAERVATAPNEAPVTASIVGAKPTGKVEVSAGAGVPTAAVPPVIVPAATARAPQTAKNEAVPTSKTLPVEVMPGDIAPPVASPPATLAVNAGANLPAVAAATPVSSPKAQDVARPQMLDAQQKPQAQALSETKPTASATEEAAVPVPEPERVLKLGAFAVPRPPAEADPPPQPVVDNIAVESAFQEGQAANCTKNISLGSMEQEKLFLAIPEWALKWYEKNQKRFPGICFSNSLMSSAQNFLVVFYTMAPRVGGAESLKNIPATEDQTLVNGKGSFTTSYGGMWHYTYENTVTTTITSVSAEKAPHNQQTTLLYATAYSDQGIPISQHWPTPNSKRGKEATSKHGKNQDALLSEFRVTAELLGQMVEDIAKH
jgi:hypothetical protein